MSDIDDITGVNDAGWRVFREGSEHVAEKYLSLPGASASTLTIKADSRHELVEAVALREQQLGPNPGDEFADVTWPDGSQVTSRAHAAARMAGDPLESPVVESPVVDEPLDVVAEDDEEEATPAAEKLANEHDVFTSDIEGSGQDGRVLVGDVEEALEAESPKE